MAWGYHKLFLPHKIYFIIEANEIIDDITKAKWVKEGVKNFVITSMDDTLKNVVDKMKELSDSLSVRAVVMEKDAPKAIVTYDMISKELQKWYDLIYYQTIRWQSISRPDQYLKPVIYEQRSGANINKNSK